MSNGLSWPTYLIKKAPETEKLFATVDRVGKGGKFIWILEW